MKVNIKPVLNSSAIPNSTKTKIAFGGEDCEIIQQNAKKKIEDQTKYHYVAFLDVSGSMGGKRLAAMKLMAKELIKRMKPGDSFEIFIFGHQGEKLVPRTVITGNESDLYDAYNKIDGLQAPGQSTYVTSATNLMKKHEDVAGYQTRCILLTDGEAHDSSERIGKSIEKTAKLYTDCNGNLVEGLPSWTNIALGVGFDTKKLDPFREAFPGGKHVRFLNAEALKAGAREVLSTFSTEEPESATLNFHLTVRSKSTGVLLHTEERNLTFLDNKKFSRQGEKIELDIKEPFVCELTIRHENLVIGAEKIEVNPAERKVDAENINQDAANEFIAFTNAIRNVAPLDGSDGESDKFETGWGHVCALAKILVENKDHISPEIHNLVSTMILIPDPVYKKKGSEEGKANFNAWLAEEGVSGGKARFVGFTEKFMRVESIGLQPAASNRAKDLFAMIRLFIDGPKRRTYLNGREKGVAVLRKHSETGTVTTELRRSMNDQDCELNTKIGFLKALNKAVNAHFVSDNVNDAIPRTLRKALRGIKGRGLIEEIPELSMVLFHEAYNKKVGNAAIRAAATRETLLAYPEHNLKLVEYYHVENDKGKKCTGTMCCYENGDIFFCSANKENKIFQIARKGKLSSSGFKAMETHYADRGVPNALQRFSELESRGFKNIFKKSSSEKLSLMPIQSASKEGKHEVVKRKKVSVPRNPAKSFPRSKFLPLNDPKKVNKLMKPLSEDKFNNNVASSFTGSKTAGMSKGMGMFGKSTGNDECFTRLIKCMCGYVEYALPKGCKVLTVKVKSGGTKLVALYKSSSIKSKSDMIVVHSMRLALAKFLCCTNQDKLFAIKLSVGAKRRFEVDAKDIHSEITEEFKNEVDPNEDQSGFKKMFDEYCLKLQSVKLDQMDDKVAELYKDLQNENGVGLQNKSI